jgi:hypothetical protein
MMALIGFLFGHLMASGSFFTQPEKERQVAFIGRLLMASERLNKSRQIQTECLYHIPGQAMGTP